MRTVRKLVLMVTPGALLRSRSGFLLLLRIVLGHAALQLGAEVPDKTLHGPRGSI